jgi:subtilisin-like proprotein convertase family protein
VEDRQSCLSALARTQPRARWSAPLVFLLLAAAVPLAAEQRLEFVRHSLTGTHCRYREYVDGIPSEEYVTRACPAGVVAVLSRESGTDRIVRPPLVFRLNGRLVQRAIVAETPLEPFAYDYDAETGELIRRVPLFFHAKAARVFDPNPVAATNDPALQDRNDSADAVPESAYRAVELEGLNESGPLAGPHVKLVDRQAPNIAPPDASSNLVLDRANDGFEDVSVYFHVDRSQRHLQALGYTGERAVVPYAIEADAHAISGSDNSFFLPSATRFGEGTLFFGEGGTDDAEDADLVVHEYGHAVQEWISPGTFGGTFASESRAMSEGFGDYWAYSAHVAQRLASGRDPFCFADWDPRCAEDDPSQQCGYRPGADCLRRLDSAATMADYDTSDIAGVEHRNGMIWSSALREIHQQLGRTVTDMLAVESLFDAPPHPTFAVMARRLIEADRLLFNGVHGQTICASMLVRGILTDCGDPRPRGEQTLFQSVEHALPIPENNSAGITSTLTITDPRAIERISVRVDITHPVRGDLRIDLIAPDGTTVLLQNASFERTADIHAIYGPFDALNGHSAAGVWKLVVRDLRALDAGTLQSWGLLLQLAGDVPLAERPGAEQAQMVPVVAHVFGVGATRFRSDVRIANPGAERVTATLVFTRSGEDGRSSFAALNTVLEAGQTIAFDDLVDSAFHTVGSGSLEVLGPVVVMSRTYAETEAGTMGQQVPPNLQTTILGWTPLFVAPLPTTTDRYNLGITETQGGSGIILAGGREVPIAPFSHVQFAVDPDLTEVRVLSGDARVSAYLSQVNNTTGDAMFIPAEWDRTDALSVIAPVISTDTWQSDLWLASTSAAQTRTMAVEAIGEQRPSVEVTIERLTAFDDVLARLFHRTLTTAALSITLPPHTFGWTRTRNGGVSELVPLLGRTETVAPREQHLVFVESGDSYRTNIGIVSAIPAMALVFVYDAAGNEVARGDLSTNGGFTQFAVPGRVTAGRARVQFLLGAGQAEAYASLIDNRTGDATYVQGR